ncbi:MAG: ChbG/HpnK family deacetylase [Candidatus Ozemobacteraceae bacterium]
MPYSSPFCITADDFGMDPGLDEGILEGIAAGGIGNVSIWTHTPNLTDLPERTLDLLSRVCIGLHWNLFPLTMDINRPGEAIEAIRSAFPDTKSLEKARLVWNFAFEALERQGLHPAFINGHQHVHLFPGWVKPVCQWAVSNGMRCMRRPRELGTGGFIAKMRRPALLVLEILGTLSARIGRRFPLTWIPALCRWGRAFTFDEVLADFEGQPGSTTGNAIELMTHPGRPTSAYLCETRSPSDHLGQLAQVCRSDLHDLLARHGFASARLDGNPLVHYRKIP